MGGDLDESKGNGTSESSEHVQLVLTGPELEEDLEHGREVAQDAAGSTWRSAQIDGGSS